MRVGDIAGLLLREAVPALRRWIIGIAAIAIAVVAALIELTSAARHALEPVTGPVWSRVIVGLAFLLIAAGAALTLFYAGRYRTARAEAAPSDAALKHRFTIIAEAVGLGFSLGRDFRKAAAPNGKDQAPPDPQAAPDPTAEPSDRPDAVTR
jgi:hypothetical protein